MSQPLDRRSDPVRFKLLIQDLDITIINATTGEIIHEIALNPDKDYQPIGQQKKKPEPSQ